MSKVSIILPVYNAEQYLAECIQSVIQQTFSDWELIIVNDGSTDHSDEIIASFSDERIKNVRKNNEGLVKAIGTGLDYCSSQYVMFIDSDDWYEKEMVETLCRAIETYKADSVMGGYKKVFPDGREVIPLPLENRIIDRKMIEDRILSPFFEFDADIYRFWSSPRWDKIYRLEIVKKIYHLKDQTLTMGEDLEFQLRFLNECDRIVSIGEQYHYCYRVLDQSMARGYSQKMENDYRKMLSAIAKTAKDQGRPFSAYNKLQDISVLNMLTELSKTNGYSLKEKWTVRMNLINRLHDKKMLLKRVLIIDFPGKETLQKMYRKLKN